MIILMITHKEKQEKFGCKGAPNAFTTYLFSDYVSYIKSIIICFIELGC